MISIRDQRAFRPGDDRAAPLGAPGMAKLWQQHLVELAQQAPRR